MLYTIVIIIALCAHSFVHTTSDVHVKAVDPQSALVTVNLHASERNYIYHDYLHASVNQPTITLSWKCDSKPIEMYDKQFKTSKQIYTKPITVHIDVSTANPLDYQDAHIIFDYYQKSDNKPSQCVIPLNDLARPRPLHDESLQTCIDVSEETSEQPQKIESPNVCRYPSKSISEYVSDIVQKTESFWIQLLFAFILGILLSLTPCIYPMIPITIGILQTYNNTKTIRSSITLALFYTMGIATTFALLGLLAAFAGQMMGTLLHNPIIIFFIVLLLLYLAGSMIGLYPMYIPRFFQQAQKFDSKKSIFSVFTFGLVSGTVASPCLSPGLVLLLSIVTTLQSKLLGFFLLFLFGIGLSLPLLIIGSFSGILSSLPKAGMWMIEIKEFFGFLMIGMSFYFLSNILPRHWLFFLGSFFSFATGVFYLYAARKNKNFLGIVIKNIIATFLIGASVLILFKAYQESYNNVCFNPYEQAWQTNYNCALSLAKQLKRPLLIDISGPACSLCHAIDIKIFQNKQVMQVLENCILLKINGADTSTDACHILHKKYQVFGFPTILLIEPEHETLLHRWGGELYQSDPLEFILEIKQYIP